MVDWNTGRPNARYRVLQLLLEEMRPGCGLVPPAAGAFPDSCYVLGLSTPQDRKALVVNKTNDDVAISVDGPTARVVDQVSAGGPIRIQHVTNGQLVLGGYAVAIVNLR
jgi:hypothetical protein